MTLNDQKIEEHIIYSPQFVYRLKTPKIIPKFNKSTTKNLIPKTHKIPPAISHIQLLEKSSEIKQGFQNHNFLVYLLLPISCSFFLVSKKMTANARQK